MFFKLIQYKIMRCFNIKTSKIFKKCYNLVESPLSIILIVPPWFGDVRVLTVKGTFFELVWFIIWGAWFTGMFLKSWYLIWKILSRNWLITF